MHSSSLVNWLDSISDRLVALNSSIAYSGTEDVKKSKSDRKTSRDA